MGLFMSYAPPLAKDSTAEARSKYGHLLRVLGIAFGWAVTLGTMIGAGILRAPGEVAQHIPSVALFFGVWLIGATYALLGALSLAELGAMIPESGGQTVFVKRAFGAFPGFAVAWSDWLSCAASAAVVTIVLLEAVVVIVPGLAPLQTPLAVAMILGMTAIQWQGIRAGATAQLVTSALKAVVFLILIVACLTADGAGARASTVSMGLTLAGFMIALQTMVFTYDGWAQVLYFSGELTNPGRDIPRSIFSAVLSVTVIYLLINIAFLHLIPLPAMAGDPMIADTASRIVFGPGGTAFIRILLAISLLSAVNANILGGPRVLYAIGVTRVNKGGTPTHAMAITSAVTILMVVTGTFNQVLALASFFFVANYSMSFGAVFKLRRSEPDTARPYRAWGFPYTTGLVLLASVSFLVAVIVTDPSASAWALGLLALSYPIHRFVLRKTA
jgi:basic amino acid/polyamine antiporter, APA family